MYQIPFHVKEIHNMTIYVHYWLSSKIYFTVRFFVNRFVLITIFKIMVVKFFGGLSLLTHGHSVSKIVVLPVYVILLLQELRDKRYRTSILWQIIWYFIFQLYPLDFMKLEHSCIFDAHMLQWEFTFIAIQPILFRYTILKFWYTEQTQ